MLSKFAHHVRRNRRAAARIFNADDLQYPDSGSASPSLDLRAYKTIKCSVTDPEDGTSLHWDQGSLTKWQLERFVPQCDQLCERCLQLADDLAQEFDRKRPRADDRYSFSHHETLGTLKSAAISGCHFCTLICSGGPYAQMNERPNATPYSLQIKISGEISGYYSPETFWGRIYIATDDEENSVDIMLHSGWFKRGPVPMTIRFPSTGDPKVLDLAKVWLEGCMTTHDQCCLLLERPLYICQSRRWHCGGRHFAQQLNRL